MTYDDQGTYIQKDFWNKEMSTLKLAVSAKSNYVKCVAGKSLHVNLEGISQNDPTMTVSGEYTNVTLVRMGARVSQDLPDYFDRVFLHNTNIEIVSVNFSDVGHYRIYDRQNRLVSVTRMDLTDHDEDTNGNPLLALLLFLGIPVGVCCCCRKKIFKRKATTAHTVQTIPAAVIPPPSGPTGPCPPYTQPQPAGYYPPLNPHTGPMVHPPPVAGPGAGQWNGPPPSAAYPPPGAIYPPAGAPQWNGPPPAADLYPPAPTAPMGYGPAPVMYSEPPPKEEIKMENFAPSPTDPLLAHPPQGEAAAPSAPVPPPSSTSLSSTDTAATFIIDKSATNFL